MDVLSILFILGCLLTLPAIAVTILLSPRPDRFSCHLRGFGLLLVFAGAAFGLVRVTCTKWVPAWEVVLFVVGIGLLSALFMRERWATAQEKERQADLIIGQQSGT